MRFRGRFERSLDSKGRLSIPPKFKEVLKNNYGNETLILTNLFEGCLVGYPLKEWEESIEEKLSTMPSMLDETKRFKRFFYSAAQEISADKQGRILVPPSLRDYADIKDSVILSGMVTYFEIWNKERFWKAIELTPEDQRMINQEMANRGI